MGATFRSEGERRIVGGAAYQSTGMSKSMMAATNVTMTIILSTIATIAIHACVIVGIALGDSAKRVCTRTTAKSIGSES